MSKKIVSILLLSLTAMLLAACQAQQGPQTAAIPVGKAYADGKEIYFMHTEASAPDVAEKLTNMMKSPVLFVPTLAELPESALAKVYVFTNGVKGSGPFGFQPDVFDNPPASPGYTPLRQLNAVTWANEAKTRELRSAQEVLDAHAAGEVAIDQPGVVINMPFVVWDGGKR
jgi:hypothetical protein